VHNLLLIRGRDDRRWLVDYFFDFINFLSNQRQIAYRNKGLKMIILVVFY